MQLMAVSDRELFVRTTWAGSPVKTTVSDYCRPFVVRSFIAVHHTFLCDLDVTSAGIRSSFLVGCHSAASLGNKVCKELVTETLSSEQNGQHLPA